MSKVLETSANFYVKTAEEAEEALEKIAAAAEACGYKTDGVKSVGNFLRLRLEKGASRITLVYEKIEVSIFVETESSVVGEKVYDLEFIEEAINARVHPTKEPNWRYYAAADVPYGHVVLECREALYDEKSVYYLVMHLLHVYLKETGNAADFGRLEGAKDVGEIAASIMLSEIPGLKAYRSVQGFFVFRMKHADMEIIAVCNGDILHSIVATKSRMEHSDFAAAPLTHAFHYGLYGMPMLSGINRLRHLFLEDA